VNSPLETPSRIALAGDWHANDRWAACAIDYAKDEGADVIIHVGDFAYDYSRKFLMTVDRALADYGIPLLFVEGNHDDPGALRGPLGPDGLRQLAPHIWHIPRGFRWQWGDVTFLGCGGAHSVDRQRRTPGVSWWPEEAITDEDVRRCVDGGPVDVLISHDCPTGVTIPGIDDASSPPYWPALEILRATEHRAVLRQIVDGCQPRTIVHGHYHRFYETVAELGYGAVRVMGLDCDGGDFAANVQVVDLKDLAAT